MAAVTFAALEQEFRVSRLPRQFLGQREDEGVIGSVGQQGSRRPEQQPQRGERSGNVP